MGFPLDFPNHRLLVVLLRVLAVNELGARSEAVFRIRLPHRLRGCDVPIHFAIHFRCFVVAGSLDKQVDQIVRNVIAGRTDVSDLLEVTLRPISLARVD